MEQLIQLKSIPIQFGFRVNRGKFEINSQGPQVDIQRQKGSFRVQTTPTRLSLDTYDARASIGLKNVADSVREASDLGVQAAYDATANFADEGNMLMDTQYGGDAFGQIAFQRSQTNLDSMLGFSPSVPVNISWTPHDINMQYEMDQLQFDWRLHNQPEIQFENAKLEYFVEQYPKLEITYVGRPIYVPPSSDPQAPPEEVFDVRA